MCHRYITVPIPRHLYRTMRFYLPFRRSTCRCCSTVAPSLGSERQKQAGSHDHDHGHKGDINTDQTVGTRAAHEQICLAEKSNTNRECVCVGGGGGTLPGVEPVKTLGIIYLVAHGLKVYRFCLPKSFPAWFARGFSTGLVPDDTTRRDPCKRPLYTAAFGRSAPTALLSVVFADGSRVLQHF